MKTFKMKKAFTLAEVLITLGVIGIVAAMIIPNLVQSYKEKVTITKVKQAYSMLFQAFKFAELENGNPSQWDLGTGMEDENAHRNFANYFVPYLKISENCVEGDKKDCIKSRVYNPKQDAGLVLNNGVGVAFRIFAPHCNDSYFFVNGCGIITIYTNPKSDTLRRGENVFSFAMTRKGIEPYGLPESYLKFEKGCNKKIEIPYPDYSAVHNMYACTAWVIYNGNMDYLKCPGELSWEGKHKCSD